MFRPHFINAIVIQFSFFSLVLPRRVTHKSKIIITNGNNDILQNDRFSFHLISSPPKKYH